MNEPSTIPITPENTIPPVNTRNTFHPINEPTNTNTYGNTLTILNVYSVAAGTTSGLPKTTNNTTVTIAAGRAIP